MSDFRSHVRVRAPPGGASSILFGTEEPLASNTSTPSKSPGGKEGAQQQRPSTPLSEVARRRMLQAVQNAATVEEVTEGMRSVFGDNLQPRGLQLDDGSSPSPNSTFRAGSRLPATQKGEQALENLKAVLKRRGVHALCDLGRRFKIMDDDNDKRLSFDEFAKAMTEIQLGTADVHALFRFIDEDCSGDLSYDELIMAVRGDLNERRKQMVALAYKVLDRDGSGSVEVSDLKTRYNARVHPEVVAGTKSEAQVLEEFLDQFDTIKKDGVVSLEEFANYYRNVSASIDDDDYFELVIRNAWHISGGEGWSANTTCRRLLVVHQDGSQSVEEITDDIDIDKFDRTAMMANLAQRGIKAQSIELYGDFSQSNNTINFGSRPVTAATENDATAKQHRQRQLGSSIIF